MDTDPSKRPDINTLYLKIQEISQVYYQNTLNKNKNIIKKFLKISIYLSCLNKNQII